MGDSSVRWWNNVSSEQNSERDAAAKQRIERRNTLLFGAIASAVIIGLIAMLMAIEIYGEKQNGEYDVPANAADR